MRISLPYPRCAGKPVTAPPRLHRGEALLPKTTCLAITVIPSRFACRMMPQWRQDPAAFGEARGPRLSSVSLAFVRLCSSRWEG